MIRTVPIPRRVARMGIVVAGGGGRAGDFQFDETGLSKDARLAYYLQDLTPSQLQTALDGGDPTPELLSLLHQEQTGTGAGWLPCGGAGNDPNCDSNAQQSGVPQWVWYAGAGVAAIAVLGVFRK